jgi:hypothetical protein
MGLMERMGILLYDGHVYQPCYLYVQTAQLNTNITNPEPPRMSTTSCVGVLLRGAIQTENWRRQAGCIWRDALIYRVPYMPWADCHA